ncbi:MAG TPA: hypothetical protein VF698_02835 [Thermoanaerobaculia bacterium]|jgi:hypothetical protein
MHRSAPLLLAALLAACAAHPSVAPAAQPPVAKPQTAAAEALVDHEGDSPQTAVSVPENAPDGGVDFENRWIYERYGRFRRSGGGTGVVEGRRYNVVKIELPDGEKKTVYFDITENWQKSLAAPDGD